MAISGWQWTGGNDLLALGRGQLAAGNKQRAFCKLPSANCQLLYGILKLSHLITEHGAGFEFILHLPIMTGIKTNYMNSNLILKSDVLDIIFEKRNKDYGAYILRKFYPGRLKLSLGIMLIIVAIFSAFTFIKKDKRVLKAKEFVFTDPKYGNIKTILDEPKQKQDPPETKTTPVSSKRLSGNMLIVPSDIKTDIITAIEETDVISNITNIGPGPGTVIVQPEKPGEATEIPAPKIDKTIPLDLNSVDIPPSYPGGIEALRKFLERNLNNPKEMEEGESVSVRIRFVVGYDGRLQHFVTVLDGGEEFNKEVVRVLKKMPEWIPGKAKGENVSVYYTLPVKFVPAN